MCNHVWVEKENKLNRINSAEKTNLKTIFIINIVLLLLVILVFIVLRGHLENIDSNWESLYFFFDLLIPIQ